MAQQTSGVRRRQTGQAKKEGLRSTEQEELLNPPHPLSMLMDMFNLLMPMEQPETGTTVAAKGAPSAAPQMGRQNTPADTFGFDAEGLLTSSPPSFQPMPMADVNMAAERMSQAGDSAQQVAAWDPFKGMVPNIGPSTPPMPQMSPRTMGEAPLEAAYSNPQAAPQQPLGVPAPNMPMPERNPALSSAGTPQLVDFPEPNPAFHGEDMLKKFFQMMAQGAF